MAGSRARVAEGRGMDMRRGRQRFGDYVTETWLPNHVIEASTRQGYTYVINKYILPEFEAMPMIEIMPGAVRDFVRKMKENGASPHTIDKAKVILSAIFTTALNDQIVFLHPCKGVPGTPRSQKPLQFLDRHAHVGENPAERPLGDVVPGVDWHCSAATVGVAHDVMAASGSRDLEASSF
jgi:hypothetical protein